MSNIPVGAYTFSDSYLRKLKKNELIEHYRTLEKNWFDEIKSSNIQMDNLKKLLKEEYNKAVDDTIKAIKEEYAFTILEEEKIDESTINHNAVRLIDNIASDFVDTNIAECSGNRYTAITIGYIKGICDMANAMKKVLKVN